MQPHPGPRPKPGPEAGRSVAWRMPRPPATAARDAGYVVGYAMRRSYDRTSRRPSPIVAHRVSKPTSGTTTIAIASGPSRTFGSDIRLGDSKTIGRQRFARSPGRERQHAVIDEHRQAIGQARRQLQLPRMQRDFAIHRPIAGDVSRAGAIGKDSSRCASDCAAAMRCGAGIARRFSRNSRRSRARSAFTRKHPGSNEKARNDVRASACARGDAARHEERHPPP